VGQAPKRTTQQAQAVFFSALAAGFLIAMWAQRRTRHTTVVFPLRAVSGKANDSSRGVKDPVGREAQVTSEPLGEAGHHFFGDTRAKPLAVGEAAASASRLPGKPRGPLPAPKPRPSDEA